MRQELADTIALLEKTPEAVLHLREGLDGDELRARADDGTFSFVEHVCHLRDLEREGYGARIEKILSEELPALPDFDGASIAREGRYNEQPFDESMAQFTEARTRNAFALKDISDEQLSRRGLLEGVGEITLERLVALMREHDMTHREELRVLREQVLGRRSNGE
ncbi:MAG: DinB family protein [Rubrivivax sp.]|nr:DinB family protein [Pyrinomonadaceae bacterium]